ncbi:MAG: hypothetical protein ABIM21_01330 [candidate division WOR-3 bacterium]
MAGHIVIKNLKDEGKKFVLSNTFDSFSVIDYKKKQVMVVSVDEIMDFVIRCGRRMEMTGRGKRPQDQPGITRNFPG